MDQRLGSLWSRDSVATFGFGGAGSTAVIFGDTPAADFTVVSDTEIDATSPVHDEATVDVVDEFAPSYSHPALVTILRLTCLSILVFVTVRRTLRPGPVTVYRVMGGIAGYLLIGYTWTFAYQLVVQQAPSAIHFEVGMAGTPSRQLNDLIYFSFITLTTVGYGDVHPVHPAARSLAVAEALVGQLYLAILIASLVGMAIQERPPKYAPAETREIGPPL